MAWELVVKEKFSSAHFLENYEGKCEKMHGHTFLRQTDRRIDRLRNSQDVQTFHLVLLHCWVSQVKLILRLTMRLSLNY